MDELILLITQPETASTATKIEAITALGNLIQNEKESFTHPKGIVCLVDQVRESKDYQLVMHAMGVLGRVGALSAVMVLIDGVLGELPIFEAYDKTNEKGLQIRASAVRALGRLKDDRAVIPLMSILNNRHENYRLRLAAAEALGKVGDNHALGSLVEIIQDDKEQSLYLKESAVKALGMLGDIRAMDSLIHILESKRGIRDKFDFLKEVAIESLGRLVGKGLDNDRATETLLQALGDEAPSIRLSAVEALGEIADFRALPKLQEMLFDANDEVAIAAVESLYHIGGERAVEDALTLEKLPQFLRHELEAYLGEEDIDDDEDDDDDEQHPFDR